MDEQLKVLVDTSVWVDLYVPHRPLAEASREVLRLCSAEDAVIFYPLRALADVYWHVQRDRKAWFKSQYGQVSEAQAHAANTDAWECVGNMMELGTPVGADVSDVWLAQRLRGVHPDFEDDMVLAAATRAKVDYLVTSDRQLIQKATVAALTPEDMASLLQGLHATHN